MNKTVTLCDLDGTEGALPIVGIYTGTTTFNGVEPEFEHFYVDLSHKSSIIAINFLVTCLDMQQKKRFIDFLKQSKIK